MNPAGTDEGYRFDPRERAAVFLRRLIRPRALDGTQTNALEALLAARASGNRRVLVYGPPISGKTQLVAKLAADVAGAGECRVDFAPIGRASGICLESEVLTVLLAAAWGDDDLGFPSSVRMRTLLRSGVGRNRREDEGQVLLVLDGLDRCLDWPETSATLSQVGAGISVVVTVSGTLEQARRWCERLGWDAQDVQLVPLPASGSSPVDGSICWTGAEPDAALSKLQEAAADEATARLVDSLALAYAPLSLDELETLTGLPAALLAERLQLLVAADGPVVGDAELDEWGFSHDEYAARWRASAPERLADLERRWLDLGAARLTQARTSLEAAVPEDYLTRYLSAHMRATGAPAESFAPMASPGWCRSDSPTTTDRVLADLERARSAAEERLVRSVARNESDPEACLWIVREAVAQAATWDLEVTEDAAELRAEARLASVACMVQLAGCSDGTRGSEILDLALGVATREGNAGVRAFLEALVEAEAAPPSTVVGSLGRAVADFRAEDWEALSAGARLRLVGVVDEGRRRQLLEGVVTSARATGSVREILQAAELLCEATPVTRDDAEDGRDCDPRLARMGDLVVEVLTTSAFYKAIQQIDHLARYLGPRTGARLASRIERGTRSLQNPELRLRVIAGLIDVLPREEQEATLGEGARLLVTSSLASDFPSLAQFLRRLDSGVLKTLAVDGGSALLRAVASILAERGHVEEAARAVERLRDRGARCAAFEELADVLGPRGADFLDRARAEVAALPSDETAKLLLASPRTILRLLGDRRALDVARGSEPSNSLVEGPATEEYTRVIRLARLLPALPEALRPEASEALHQCLLLEPDAEALGEVIRATPWIDPPALARIFNGTLVYAATSVTWPGALTGWASVAHLAPWIQRLGGDAAVAAIAQELAGSDWFSGE